MEGCHIPSDHIFYDLILACLILFHLISSIPILCYAILFYRPFFSTHLISSYLILSSHVSYPISRKCVILSDIIHLVRTQFILSLSEQRIDHLHILLIDSSVLCNSVQTIIQLRKQKDQILDINSVSMSIVMKILITINPITIMIVCHCDSNPSYFPPNFLSYILSLQKTFVLFSLTIMPDNHQIIFSFSNYLVLTLSIFSGIRPFIPSCNVCTDFDCFTDLTVKSSTW